MSTNEIKLKIVIDGKEATAAINMTDEELKQLARSLRSANEQSETTGEGITSVFANARNVIQGVKETFDVFRQTLAAPIQAFAEMEQANISFEVLLGSAEKAKTMLKDLRTLGAETPLEFTGLQKNAQTLLSFGIAAEDILPTVKMLGDVSGGDAQKMESLTLAFAQMMSTGKLMGQDLLQMINAGFNPLQIIAEKTGKSIGDLKKEMELGAISSEDIAKAFKDATSEGGRYHDMLKRQANSTAGAISNFNDTITTLKQSSGGALAVGLTPLLNTFNQILTALNSASPALTGVIGSLGLLGTAFVTLRVTGIIPAISSMHLFGAALLSVKGAMISTGIGAAIVLLGIGLGELAKAFNAAKTAKDGFDAALKFTPEAEATKAGQENAIKNAEELRKGYNQQRDQIWTELKNMGLRVEDIKRIYNSNSKGGDENINNLIARLREVNQQLSVQAKFIDANKKAMEAPAKNIVPETLKGKKKTAAELLREEIDKDKAELEWTFAQARSNKETFDEILALSAPHYSGLMQEVAVPDKPEINLGEASQTFTDITGKTSELTYGAYSANMVFSTLGRTITGALGNTLHLFKQANSVAQQFVNNITDAVAELLIMQSLKGLFNLVTGGTGGFMGGFRLFADGGIVTAPTLGLVGEAGPEAVIPLNQFTAMQSSAPVVNVNLSGSLDMDLRKLSFRLNKIETLIAKYN